MEQQKYWDRFTQSGRIDDYLRYLGVENFDSKECGVEVPYDEQGDIDAGIYMDNRNDT